MALSGRVGACQRGVLDSATIGAAYQPIQAAGFDEAVFLIRIVNDSNIDINISYNGIQGHDYVRAGETLQLDFTNANLPGSAAGGFSRGARVYVAAPAPGAGSIYLAGYFRH